MPHPSPCVPLQLSSIPGPSRIGIALLVGLNVLKWVMLCLDLIRGDPPDDEIPWRYELAVWSADSGGRGLVGVVAKPTSGLAALVAKTTEGLASDAKRVTVRGKEAKGSHELRVRQPRELGSVLLPYPGAPSLKF